MRGLARDPSQRWQTIGQMLEPFRYVLENSEESDDEVAAAWASELERRSREVAEGRVQTAPWDAVRTAILKELEQQKAGVW